MWIRPSLMVYRSATYGALLILVASLATHFGVQSTMSQNRCFRRFLSPAPVAVGQPGSEILFPPAQAAFPFSSHCIERCRRSRGWGVNSGLPGAYLCEGVSYPQWEAFFDALFSGRISNGWTRQDWMRVPKVLDRWRLAERIGFRMAKIQYQSRYMRGNRYVIKEIRANLMLDWLSSRTNARIVYVIRHPCAVIASRLSRIQQQDSTG